MNWNFENLNNDLIKINKPPLLANVSTTILIYGILFLWIIMIIVFYLKYKKTRTWFKTQKQREKTWIILGSINATFTMLWMVSLVVNAETLNKRFLYFDLTFTSFCAFGSTLLIFASFLKSEKMIKMFVPLSFVGGLLAFVAPPRSWYLYSETQIGEFVWIQDWQWIIKQIISINYHAFAFTIICIYVVTVNWNFKKDATLMYSGYALYLIWALLAAYVPYLITENTRWLQSSAGLFRQNYYKGAPFGETRKWLGGYPYVAIGIHLTGCILGLLPIAIGNPIMKTYYGEHDKPEWMIEHIKNVNNGKIKVKH